MHVQVNEVRPSTFASDHTGAVDASVTITVEGKEVTDEVTLYPNLGRSTVGGVHPIDTCGTPLDVCVGLNIVGLLVELETTDGHEVVSEICRVVNAFAREKGLLTV